MSFDKKKFLDCDQQVGRCRSNINVKTKEDHRLRFFLPVTIFWVHILLFPNRTAKLQTPQLCYTEKKKNNLLSQILFFNFLYEIWEEVIETGNQNYIRIDSLSPTSHFLNIFYIIWFIYFHIREQIYVIFLVMCCNVLCRINLS